jgi:NAD(P)-dependent dehydrogenase (short-subunit alcohol dehydrogenase family)
VGDHDPTREDFDEAASKLVGMPTPGLDSIDVSKPVLYLVSDAGRFVTGTTLVVNAGGLL